MLGKVQKLKNIFGDNKCFYDTWVMKIKVKVKNKAFDGSECNMAGWDLKKGELQLVPIHDDQLWARFNFVFSDASAKRNSYKFGLIKSILDNLLNCTIEDDKFVLFYHDIFAKFTESYWNLVLKYHLRQMRPDGKSQYSKIEQILRQAQIGFKIPEQIPFDSLNATLQETIIAQVQRECRKYVIGALYSDLEGIVYGFDKKEKYLVLHPTAYQFLMKYKMELERLNYYAWAKFLETVNDDSLLVRLLNKLELASPQRKNLDIYRQVLYQEFGAHYCFYCGKKLTGISHVDHFIPWSFVKEDKLWNFVLSCPSCNNGKSNKLPAKPFVEVMEERNSHVVLRSDFSRNQFASYRQGLISHLWQYAHNAGFQVYKTDLDLRT